MSAQTDYQEEVAMRLQNKVAIITGADSGIGKAIALQMAREGAAVTIDYIGPPDDATQVVRQIEGDPERGFIITLNDGTREPLDPSSLRCGADNAFYCRVKDGECEARLLRPAHYALAQWAEAGADGRFSVRVGGREFPLDAR